MTIFDNHTVWVRFYNFADMSASGKDAFYHYTVDGKAHFMYITPAKFYKKHPKTGKFIYQITFSVHDLFELKASFFVRDAGGIFEDKFFNPKYQLLRGSTLQDVEHHVTMMLLGDGNIK